MRALMLISLPLLTILIHEAQGMRSIREGTPIDGQHIIHKTLQRIRSKNDGVEDIILCKENHCSGRNRKLLMAPISSTTTTFAKNQNNKNKDKIATKEENLSVNSSATTEQQPAAAPETYPGILDIAGMDYSQARRKPPIHN